MSLLAIGRGGYVPATILSHILGVRQIAAVQTTSYADNHQKGNVSVISPYPWNAAHQPTGIAGGGHWHLPLHPEIVIILDDLVDTGDTLQTVERWVLENAWKQNVRPFIVKAVAFGKEGKDHHETLFGALAPDAWLVFPFETEE